jgi:hypothetical protein
MRKSCLSDKQIDRALRPADASTSVAKIWRKREVTVPARPSARATPTNTVVVALGS